MAKVKIQVQCHLCGKTYEVEVESKDYNDFRAGCKSAQVAFPYLSAADRELLISQTCGECWEKLWEGVEDE